jgi:antirestriction protein ArdC
MALEFTLALDCQDMSRKSAQHSPASYVGPWLGILRGDKTAIIHAAAKAEQAFAYLKSFGGAADDSVRDEPTAAAALAA